MNKFFIIVSFLSLGSISSCSNYVSSLRAEIQKDQGSRGKIAFEQDKNSSKFIVDRIGLYLGRPGINSFNKNSYNQHQRNQYKEIAGRRRFKASDLVDKEYDGSLWSPRVAEKYLISHKREYDNGDVILLNVQEKLKEEITQELSYAFASKNTQTPSQTATAAPVAIPPQQTGEEKNKESNKIFDRVTSVIIETINDKHVLIRGRKYVLFEGRKRLVEIEALALKTAVNFDETLNSNDILESTIHVVRQ